jgi:hypothetical protein
MLGRQEEGRHSIYPISSPLEHQELVFLTSQDDPKRIDSHLQYIISLHRSTYSLCCLSSRDHQIQTGSSLSPSLGKLVNMRRRERWKKFDHLKEDYEHTPASGSSAAEIHPLWSLLLHGQPGHAKEAWGGGARHLHHHQAEDVAEKEENNLELKLLKSMLAAKHKPDPLMCLKP